MFSKNPQHHHHQTNLVVGGGGGNSPRLLAPHALSAAAIFQQIVPPPPKVAATGAEGHLNHFSTLDPVIPWVSSGAPASVLLNPNPLLYNSSAAASLIDWRRHLTAAATAASSVTAALSPQQPQTNSPSSAPSLDHKNFYHKRQPSLSANSPPKFPQQGELKLGPNPRFPFNLPPPTVANQLVSPAPPHLTQRSPNPSLTDVATSLWNPSLPLNANNLNAFYHGLSSPTTSIPYKVPIPGLKWVSTHPAPAGLSSTGSGSAPIEPNSTNPNLLLPWVNHLAAKRLLSSPAAALVASYPTSAVAASFLQRLSQVQQQQQHLCCPHCQKKFGSSSALTKHKLIHSHLRRFACKLCGKRFKRQDHLSGHLMTHAVNKPFACGQTGCNKSYCDQRSLRRHLEKDHHKFKIDPSELKKRKVSHILFKTAVAESDSEKRGKENGVPLVLEACFTFDSEKEENSDCCAKLKTYEQKQSLVTGKRPKSRPNSSDLVDYSRPAQDDDNKATLKPNQTNQAHNPTKHLACSNQDFSSSSKKSFNGVQTREQNPNPYVTSALISVNCDSVPLSQQQQAVHSDFTRSGSRSSDVSEDLTSSSELTNSPLGAEVEVSEEKSALGKVSEGVVEYLCSAVAEGAENSESTLCIACGEVFYSQQRLTSHYCAFADGGFLTENREKQTRSETPTEKGARKRKRISWKTDPTNQTYHSRVKATKCFTEVCHHRLENSTLSVLEAQTKTADRVVSPDRHYYNFLSVDYSKRNHLDIRSSSLAGIEYDKRRCFSNPLPYTKTVHHSLAKQHLHFCRNCQLRVSKRTTSCPPLTSYSDLTTPNCSKNLTNDTKLQAHEEHCPLLERSLKGKFFEGEKLLKMAQSPWSSPTSRNLVRLKTDQNSRQQDLPNSEMASPTGLNSQSAMRHPSPNRFTTAIRPTRVSMPSGITTASAMTGSKGRPSSVRPAHRSLEISSLDDLSSPLPECNKYRSASVDETKLHPKQPLDEFLNVVDEYITSDLKQMDEEKSERELQMKRRLSDKSSSSNSSCSTQIAAGERTPYTPDENISVLAAVDHKTIRQQSNFQGTAGSANAYCAHPSKVQQPNSMNNNTSAAACATPTNPSDYSAHFSFSDRALQYHGHFSESNENLLRCGVRSGAHISGRNNKDTDGSSFMPPLGGASNEGGGFQMKMPTGITPLETPKTNDSVFTFDVPPKSPMETKNTPIVSSYHIFKGNQNISTTPKGTIRSPIRQSPGGTSSPGVSPLTASTGVNNGMGRVATSAVVFDENLSAVAKHRKTEASLSIDSDSADLVSSPSAVGPPRHHSATTTSESSSQDDSPSEGGIFKIPHDPRSSLPNYQSIKRKSKPPSLNIARDYLGTSTGSGGTGVYQSWLRSPRHDFIAKGKSGLGRLSSNLKISSSSAPSIGGSKKETGLSTGDCPSAGGIGGGDSSGPATAVPYTPPPMLCPLRNGSGLFASQFAATTPISSVNKPLKRSSVSGSFSVEDKSEEEVLEPAINIGAQFQAAIPHLRSASVNDTKSCGSVETLKDRAVLLWSPSTCKSFSQNELESYFTLANSCAINGGGSNAELAHHVLNLYRNIKSSLKILLRRKPRFVEANCPFIDYPYQNSTKWSHSDRMEFNRAWKVHGKDFHHIAKEIPSKSVKQLVEYYYSWKVMCPSEVVDPTVLDECDFEEDNKDLKLLHRGTAHGRGDINGDNSPSGIIELDSTLSSPPKKRKLSCQYENCFEIFDCQENLNAHIATCHSEGGASGAGLSSFLDERQSSPFSGTSTYLDNRCGASSASTAGLRKPIPFSNSNTPYNSNINSEGSSVTSVSQDDERTGGGAMYDFGSSVNPGSSHKTLDLTSGMHHGVGGTSGSMRGSYSTDSSTAGSKPTASNNADCSYFPCKLCGKIFYKVKSRNAHMKSHSLKVLAEREANAALRNNGVTSQIQNMMIPHSTPQQSTIPSSMVSSSGKGDACGTAISRGSSSMAGGQQRLFGGVGTDLSSVSSSSADNNIYNSSSSSSNIALTNQQKKQQLQQATSQLFGAGTSSNSNLTSSGMMIKQEPNTSLSSSSSSTAAAVVSSNFHNSLSFAHALSNSPPTLGSGGGGGGSASHQLYHHDMPNLAAAAAAASGSIASIPSAVIVSSGAHATSARMHIMNETVVSPSGEVQNNQALQIDLQPNPVTNVGLTTFYEQRRLWQQ